MFMEHIRNVCPAELLLCWMGITAELRQRDRDPLLLPILQFHQAQCCVSFGLRHHVEFCHLLQGSLIIPIEFGYHTV